MFFKHISTAHNLTISSAITHWCEPYTWYVTDEKLMVQMIPDSKVHGANMGPIWGRQDPGGPHVGPMNFAIWDGLVPPSHEKNVDGSSTTLGLK